MKRCTIILLKLIPVQPVSSIKYQGARSVKCEAIINVAITVIVVNLIVIVLLTIAYSIDYLCAF